MYVFLPHLIGSYSGPSEDVWASVSVKSIGKTTDNTLLDQFALLHINSSKGPIEVASLFSGE